MSKLKKLVYLAQKADPSYLISKFDAFLKLWISQNVRLLPPTTLMIEPTNLCNLKCPLCPTGLGTLNRPKRTLTYENFQKIIDQVQGYVKEIIFWNYGEPFLNKNAIPMIRYASDKKINVITSTNGHYFNTPEYCEEVVKSGLHRTIIAIDGATQESYEQYRIGGNLEKVLNGVRNIVAAKERLNSKTPYIELQFILMKHNTHQKEQMRKLAKELKVDHYIEKEVGIHPDDPKMFALREKYLPQTAQDKYYVNDKGEPEINGYVPNTCDWPYRYSVVNADGNVVPCCNDIDSKYVMGNIFEEDFMTIWRNHKYNSLRNRIRKNRKEIDLCRICPNGVKFNKTAKVF